MSGGGFGGGSLGNRSANLENLRFSKSRASPYQNINWQSCQQAAALSFYILALLIAFVYIISFLVVWGNIFYLFGFCILFFIFVFVVFIFFVFVAFISFVSVFFAFIFLVFIFFTFTFLAFIFFTFIFFAFIFLIFYFMIFSI